MSAFERLSALDCSFLDLESGPLTMHVGAVAVHRTGPLARPDGGIDFERITRYVEGVLDQLPRYRQRLCFAPGTGHPAWIDDDRFNLSYHLRHTALPRPGDERQLKRLAGRIFSQALDRNHPLWEMWVVEGLDGDRFAIVSKIHHCMIDGIAGANLLTLLLTPGPLDEPPAAKRWNPAPPPGKARLIAEEVTSRVRAPGQMLGNAAGALRRPGEALRSAREVGGGIGSALKDAVRPASATPINPAEVGPHRRFDVLETPLARVKAVKKALGGTVNDVVLATVAGAVRRYLERHGADPGAIRDFRVLVPASVRDPKGSMVGNQVSMAIARLPIQIADTRERYDATRALMDYLKGDSHQIEGGAFVEHLSDTLGVPIIQRLFGMATRLRVFNLVVTNVPGPQFPLYLLGSQLEAIYPLVPLFAHQSLGIALFSYDGKLCWGIVGDWDRTADLHDLIVDLEQSFAELEQLAGTGTI